MRVGLDLDNTIVCYDELFVRLAVEQGLLTSGQAADKTAVRDRLRAAGREDEWTRLQGLAYGPRMVEARPFDGVLAFIEQARRDGVSLCIISHRSRRPYAGPTYDLHAAARNWLARYGLDWIETHLEVSREAKFARIAAAGCDMFVDDLPEFLGDGQFPARVQRVLFAPTGGSDDEACRGDGSGHSPWKVVRTWPQISRWIVTPAA